MGTKCKRKTYIIEFTEQCSIELRDIYLYIQNNSNNEVEAKRLMQKIEKQVKGLMKETRKYLRYKYEGIEKCYRKIVIGNITILYRANDENKIVYVAHVYKD